MPITEGNQWTKHATRARCKMDFKLGVAQTPADFEAIAVLDAMETNGDDENWQCGPAWSIVAEMGGRVVTLSEDGLSRNVLAACAFFVQQDVVTEILRVVVAREHRRKGLASYLIANAVGAADYFDCSVVTADVDEQLLPMQLCLKQFGFVCTSIKKWPDLSDIFRFELRMSETCGGES